MLSYTIEALTAIPYLLEGCKPVRAISINGGVNAFGYCRTVNILATGGFDKIIRVWHPGVLAEPSGRLFGHVHMVIDIEINDVDKHIISLSTARVIRVWDIMALTALQVFNDTNNLTGEKRIFAMHFDSVHERLITGSSVVDAWPLTRSVQNTIQIPSTHAQPLTALISGCRETVIRVWDVEDGQLVHHIEDAHGEFGELSAMVVDDSGYRLATGASDGSIKVWDLLSGRPLKSSMAAADHSAVVGLSYCQVNGLRCITAVGRNNHIMLFSDSSKSNSMSLLRAFNDVTSGKHRLGNVAKNAEADSTSLRMGMTSPTANKATSVLDGRLMTCSSVSTTSSGVVMATGCSDGSIILWDIATAAAINVILEMSNSEQDIGNAVLALRFIEVTPASQQKVDNICDDVIDDNADSQSSSNGHENLNQSSPETVAKSKIDLKNYILASSHADGIIQFWSVEGDRLSQVSNRKFEPVTAMCTNNSGSSLFTGDVKGYITRWNAVQDTSAKVHCVKFTEVVFWRAHLVSIVQLVFIDKLDTIFSASADASVRVWTSNGTRYVGFLGQPRALEYDRENHSQYQQRQRQPQDPISVNRASEEALPFDITEGPQRPLKTMSAVRRQQEQRRSGFNCPLVFDSSRWETSTRPTAATEGQSTEAERHSTSEKNKFFGALLKPSRTSRHPVQSYTTVLSSEEAVYRLLPVYELIWPARPRTPQLTSLPKLMEGVPGTTKNISRRRRRSELYGRNSVKDDRLSDTDSIGGAASSIGSRLPDCRMSRSRRASRLAFRHMRKGFDDDLHEQVED